MKPINLGILGLGTVGAATVSVLKNNVREITRRGGCDFVIKTIVVKSLDKSRDIPLQDITLSDDAMALVNDPDIDIIVELIGGELPAYDILMQAINQGKHIVTANKALIANKGNALFAAAQQKGVMIAFEAAVAGGIPIVKALREGLAANHIHQLTGIINGTCNYILSQMQHQNLAFGAALEQAQQAGFAEACPSFDIEGIDVAHKLTILASIAFGIPLQFEKVYTEGITGITQQDLAYAQSLGFYVKHLGIAKRTQGGVELRVHPTLIPMTHTLSHVNGAMNAVLVDADAVGSTLYSGQGAGGLPTASAVVADIVDVMRTLTADPHHRVPHLAFQSNALDDLPILPISACKTAYYLRIMAADKPGVLAQITQILATVNISIDSILQKEAEKNSQQVPIIIITHQVLEKSMQQAITQMQALSDLQGPVLMIRLENLE